MEGVFRLELEAWNGSTLSRATSFMLKSPYSQKSYVVTSFHLLNANLMNAKKIKLVDQDNQVKYLNVVFYDELNDIMLLAAENLNAEGFSLAIGTNCEEEQNVIGYNNQELFNRTFSGYEETEIRGAYRIPIYLRNGFSGSPILNNNANVCSMVALSSERNASSIVISGEIIARALKQADATQEHYDISRIRQLMGLEKIVRNQEDLNNVIASKGNKQMIIDIRPEVPGSDFRIQESSNLVVTGVTGVGNLIVHNSSNIMLREMRPNRIVLNESSGVSVTACIFNKKDKALYIRNSSDYSVYGNLFKNINTGIVLKVADVNLEQKSYITFDKNYFQNVVNKVSSI